MRTGSDVGMRSQRAVWAASRGVLWVPDEWRGYGDNRPKPHHPCFALTRSVRRKGVLDQALRRCPAAGGTDHVDESAQRGRDLPVAGIIQKEALDEWRPVLQHADQLSRAQE